MKWPTPTAEQYIQDLNTAYETWRDELKDPYKHQRSKEQVMNNRITAIVDDPISVTVAEDTVYKTGEDDLIPAKRQRLPRESTTVNNPRRMDKFTRRVLRRRANKI